MITPLAFSRPSRLMVLRSLCLAALLGVALAPVGAQAETRLSALIERFTGAASSQEISHSNGRIEAQTVDVATKYAGRIDSIAVSEGDLVAAGDVIAQMETRDTQAKLNGAKAAVLSARASKTLAEATLMQAESALSVAQTTYDRTLRLRDSGTAAQSVLDDATNALNSAQAAVAMARAQIENADALIAASEADVEQVQIALDDLTIRAPLRGRVLYRLHEPGEVLAAGYPVVTLLDLTNVYMNIYLPAPVVGQLTLNDEARLVLDPIPDLVLPARVSFISPQSQFTPKNVETEQQREELVFRVKLAVPRDLLERYEAHIKSGVRGIGFVRTAPDAPWPDDLQVKLPE